ncbi:MAG: DMT family transporter, partial [Victivallaceae bacterium]|nr:DMT family transporter [Victivallaceae bacterium]
ITLFGGTLLVQVFNLDIMSMGNIGDGLIIGGAFMLSLNSFIIKRLSAPLGPVRLAAFNCGINVLVFAIAMIFWGDVNSILELSGKSCLTLLLCGVCSFVFFAGYYSGVRELPVWKVRLIALAAPVFTVLGGWMILEETLSGQSFIGIVLVLTGAAALIKINDKKELTKTKVKQWKKKKLLVN